MKPISLLKIIKKWVGLLLKLINKHNIISWSYFLSMQAVIAPVWDLPPGKPLKLNIRERKYGKP